MIYLFAVVILSGSFLALFALWLLVWTFTMSDEAPASEMAMLEDPTLYPAKA